MALNKKCFNTDNTRHLSTQMLKYWLSISYYYSNAILGNKILIAPYWTKSNKTKPRLQLCFQMYTNNFGYKLAQKLRQKPVSAKVAETLVETCFCQDCLNRCSQKLANTVARAGLDFPLDTLQVISVMIFAANYLIGLQKPSLLNQSLDWY